MSNGTTAIQVSPVDLARIMQEMASAIIELPQLRETLTASQARAEEINLANERQADTIARLRLELAQKVDALHLLELQNKGTEEELERTKASVDSFRTMYEASKRDVTSLFEQLEAVKRERDDYGMKHLEVSEALAIANAKLEKFRELLGIDSGPAPTVQSPEPTPPALLDGSGSMEPAADTVEVPKQPWEATSHTDFTAPEVAEARPTSAPSTTTTPDGSSNPAQPPASLAPLPGSDWPADWDEFSRKW